MVNIYLEEKIELVFNSFNNELKSLIIGFLVDSSKQSANQLLSKAKLLTNNDKAFKGKSSIANYFNPERQGNLSYFIEQTDILEVNKKTKSTFSLSEFGLEYGVPIARFLLYSTKKFELPLMSWLGMSQQNGPATMINLLGYLKDNQSINLTKLVEQMPVTEHAVILKIEKLKRANLITYESFVRDNGIRYKRSPYKKDVNDNGNFVRYPLITRSILDYIEKNDSAFSVEDIMEFSGFSSKKAIQNALRTLERRGYLIAVSPWHGKEKMSSINLAERGNHIITDVINPIIGFIDNDPKSKEFVLRKALYLENIPLVMLIYRSGLKS